MKKVLIGIVVFVILGGLGHMIGKRMSIPKKAVLEKDLTLEELKQYNGLNGQPMFVAVDGTIYDITKCKYWRNGDHISSKGKAVAGRDLTDVLKQSAHGLTRLKAYPIVGKLITQ